MSGTDWLKMWCSTLDNPIVMKDAEHFMLWHVILYLTAAVPQKAFFGGKRIDVQPGQLVTDRKQLAAKTGISESKVQRILKTLESEHQIEQQISSKNRLITVLNWHRYQGSEHQIEHQLNIKGQYGGQTGGEPKVNFPIITRNRESIEYIEPTTTPTTSMVVGAPDGGSGCGSGDDFTGLLTVEEMAANRQKYGSCIERFERIKAAPLSPHELDGIVELVDEYGSQWVMDALKIAGDNSVIKLSYIAGTLQRWKADGRNERGKMRSANMSREERLAAIVQGMKEYEKRYE